MARNRIGDTLAQYNDRFADCFEQDAQVRNYLSAEAEGTPTDDYGDPVEKPAHPDNPIQTTAQVEAPSRELEKNAWGIDQAYEAEILLPDDVLVSDGTATDSEGRSLPYGSEITVDGVTWTVIATIDEDNGRTRCAVAED